MYCLFAFLLHFGLMTSLANGERIRMKCFDLPASFDQLVEHIDESNLWVSELKTNILKLDTQHNPILQISQSKRHDCSGTYKKDIKIEDAKLTKDVSKTFARYLPMLRHKALSSGENYEVSK